MIRALAFAALLALLGSCSGGAPGVLRVCADPNNLPFSNRAGQGFENRLAELLAAELGASVSYTWWAQRRGSIRETLNAGRCDIMPGVGAGLEMLATTRPYYASTYVALTRRDRDLDVASFDDPRLRDLRIGVQMIGDDFSNTPPAHALARRGIVGNVRGYMIYGDYARPAPQARIVEAVATGEIDIAFVWGPVAGYFARRQPVALRITAVEPRDDGAEMPMAFAVAVGLRRGESELKERLDQALSRRRSEIDRLLEQYGVPRVASAAHAGEDDNR